MKTLDLDKSAFVDAYMQDRNAPAAAQRIGKSPRTARRYLADDAVRAEINRRQSVVAAEVGVSAASLLQEAEAARQLAEREGSASGMVAASALKAKLLGFADGSASQSEPEDAPMDPRQTARAILNLLSNGGLPLGFSVGFALPGEVLLRVPAHLAATIGGAAPLSVDHVFSPVPAASEVFPNGARVERVEIVPERGPLGGKASPAVTKWCVTDAFGAPHSFHLNRDDAVTHAMSLPPAPGGAA